MNRFEMFAAMISSQVVTLTRPSGARVTGRIKAIELEDGSGLCFNVRLQFLDGHSENIFIRNSPMAIGA